MKLNLQFFADEEISTGAEVSAPAEQMETVGNDAGIETTEGSTPPEGAQTLPKETQSSDMNAVYAQARRRAEAEMKRKQDALNSMFAEAFGNYVNPKTGKKITTAEEYITVYREQRQAEQEAELEKKGIDKETINEIVANSPQMQKYKQMLDYYEQKETEDMMKRDLEELKKLNPSIDSFDKVPREVIDKMNEKKVSMVDAYMLCTYGKVAQQQASAIQQRTINQIAGKSHLAPVNGVVQNTNEVEIPSDQVASWKEWYPNLSDAELRKKYNRVINH